MGTKLFLGQDLPAYEGEGRNAHVALFPQMWEAGKHSRYLTDSSLSSRARAACSMSLLSIER